MVREYDSGGSCVQSRLLLHEPTALALLADEWQVHRFDLQGKSTG